MVLLPSGGRRLVLWLDIFQMARPGELDEYGHGYSGEERITGLVSEADRQKAENERRSFFPIPEILVEQVNCANQQGQQKVLCLSHVIDASSLLWTRDLSGPIGKCKQMGIGLNVHDPVGHHRCPINRRTEVRLADNLLILARGHHNDIAVFVAHIEFSIRYQGGSPDVRFHIVRPIDLPRIRIQTMYKA